jgi:hypothetical protein
MTIPRAGTKSTDSTSKKGQLGGVAAQLKVDKYVDLDDFKGKCFLKFMEVVKSPDIDPDDVTPFTVPTAAEVNAALKADFDPSVGQKILKALPKGQADLDRIVNALTGKQFTPAKIGDAVYKLGGNSALPPVIAMVGHAGTCVKVGKSGNYFEVGYAKGDDRALAKDVMTGRGYAQTAHRRALDPSDAYYLGELGSYLKGSDPGALYNALLKLVVQCDASGMDKLSSDSQLGAAVGMDFVAVYHAEGDRNLMDPDMKQHSWQKDLLAATALASYLTAAGGDPTIFWDKSTQIDPKTGKPSGRSGIGITRTARDVLAEKVGTAVRKQAVYTNLEKLVGGSQAQYKGNLIQQLTDYLNTQLRIDDIAKNGDQIVSAATEFLVYIHKNAKTINAGNTLPKV